MYNSKEIAESILIRYAKQETLDINFKPLVELIAVELSNAFIQGASSFKLPVMEQEQTITLYPKIDGETALPVIKVGDQVVSLSEDQKTVLRECIKEFGEKSIETNACIFAISQTARHDARQTANPKKTVKKKPVGRPKGSGKKQKKG